MNNKTSNKKFNIILFSIFILSILLLYSFEIYQIINTYNESKTFKYSIEIDFLSQSFFAHISFIFSIFVVFFKIAKDKKENNIKSEYYFTVQLLTIIAIIIGSNLIKNMLEKEKSFNESIRIDFNISKNEWNKFKQDDFNKIAFQSIICFDSNDSTACIKPHYNTSTNSTLCTKPHYDTSPCPTVQCNGNNITVTYPKIQITNSSDVSYDFLITNELKKYINDKNNTINKALEKLNSSSIKINTTVKDILTKTKNDLNSSEFFRNTILKDFNYTKRLVDINKTAGEIFTKTNEDLNNSAIFRKTILKDFNYTNALIEINEYLSQEANNSTIKKRIGKIDEVLKNNSKLIDDIYKYTLYEKCIASTNYFVQLVTNEERHCFEKIYEEELK